MTHVKGTRGFTLLELSIVLIIIAIVTTMAVSSGISVVASARQTATVKKMKAIDDALMAFRVANDRLPCPGDLTITPGSTDYGSEAGADASSSISIGTGVCTGTGMLPQANHTAPGATYTGETGAEGTVPTVTLGLPNDFMYDGWGNHIRYAVDISMTAAGAFSGSGLACPPSGAITVKDANGVARSSGSIYALISHGSNGHGAYTQNGVTVNAASINTNELINCHCTGTGAYNNAYAPTYVQMNPTVDSTNSLDKFDDVVSYKERWQMPTAWDKTGACQFIYVADSGGNRVEKFDLNGNYISQLGGCSSGACSSGTGNGQFNNPNGIAIDASGNVWVVDTNSFRVQEFSSSGMWLASLGGGSACAACLCTGPSTCPSNGGTGGNGQFWSPFGVAIAANGNIWVTEAGDYRFQEFAKNGNYINTFGSYGTGPGENQGLGFVTIDSSGNLWVASNSLTGEWSGSGSWIQNIPAPGGTSAAIYTSGNLWVTDEGGAATIAIDEYNIGGTHIGSLAAFGYPNGQFTHAQAIAIDPSGNFWITDNWQHRVQKLSSSGAYISQLGCASGACTSGTGNGQFNGPTGIAIGR